VVETRDFGLAGVDLEAGDHICALYLGQQERDDIVLPYLRAGLRAGDKCIAVVDAAPDDHTLAGIGNEQEIGGYVASKQLEVHTTVDTYLQVAPFSPERMIEFWDGTVGAAMRSGSFRFARVSGEVPFAVRTAPLRTQFFEYEAALNRFAPRYPQTLLCLYDLSRFGGGFLVDIMRTHPRLLMGGLILENPHYRPPGDFITPPA
jgi:hypothetical protein